MKNIFLLIATFLGLIRFSLAIINKRCLTALLFFTTYIGFSQTPTTCTNAVNKSFPLNTFTVSNYSDSVYWFKMNLNAGDYRFEYTNISATGKIHKCEVYSGTCSNLILKNQDYFSYGDSLLENNFSITSTQDIYFRLVNSGTNTSFVVSAPSLLFITGQTSFCPGQTITIFPTITNSVTGTPTVTWMPGGSNSFSLTLTPSSPMTYTCQYKDGAGVLTNTINIFQLPSWVCNSCEYVNNGHLEWYGNLGSTYNPFGYGLNYVPTVFNWFIPQYLNFPFAGGHLYMNGDWSGTSMGSHAVPTSFWESNLPAHSGKGYARIQAGAFNAPWLNSPEKRDYLENKLKHPLATGQTYSITFWAANSHYGGWPGSIDHLGAFLSVNALTLAPTSALYYTVFPTTYTPQIESSGVFTSCSGFSSITGTMTGSGEQYVTIGNFYNDASTTQSLSLCVGTNTTVGPYAAVYYIDDLSVIPVPPTLSVSHPTITNCSQTTITLTASGAAPAYTSWTDGVNVYNGNIVVVPVPTFNTTYTCTVNLPGVGTCGLGGTVTVYNACTTCTASSNVLPTVLTNTSLSGTFYSMNNNLTINGSVTLTNCEVQIIKSASITVTPGSTLNIAGCHLYACGDMWQGIVVQAGGVINIINSASKTSFIEDAIVAVEIQGGSPLTTNILTANYVTFNKNKSSINIAGYTPSVSPYPFTIWGCLFTSRNIPFTVGALTWPNNNIIKAANNPTTTPLETPYINNTNYPPTTLKNPYLNTKPDFGIYIDNVGATINASTTPTYYEITIGTGSGTSNRFNVFDNLVRCVKGIDANIFCVNNIFQNTQTVGKGASGGIGIDMYTYASNYRIKVAGSTPTTYINRFFNCSKALNTLNYFEHIITDCDLRSTNTAYIIPVVPTNPPGNIGFNMVTAQYRNINISGNHLYNIANGILFTADIGYFSVGSPPTNGRYGGQVNIDNNEIRSNLVGQPITTQFVNSAISLNDVMTSTSGYSVYTIPGSSLTLNTNTITDVWNGIAGSNFGQQPLTTFNNTVTLVNQPTSYATPPVQYGISNTQINDAFIYRNSITGPATYTTQMRAITTSMNNTITVKCNITSQTERGIDFNSTQANTIFWDNTMSSHTYGFDLDNAGIIGTQGSSTVPTDNQWIGTWNVTPSTPLKTATFGTSSSTLSPLFIRYGTGFYDPNNSSWTDLFFGTDDYFYPGAGSTLLNISGSPSARTCPITPLCPSCRGFGQAEPITSNETLLENLAYGKILHLENNEKTNYLNKVMAYRQITPPIKSKSSNKVNSALQQFYNSTAKSNIGDLFLIEQDLMAQNYTQAKSKIAAFVPDNSIETNYITYYNVYTNSKQGLLNSADSLALVTLANGCPFTDGGVVYQARALYSVVFDTYRLFYDICNVSTNQRLIDNKVPKNLSVINFSRVYPNPTSGSVYIEVSDALNKEEIEVEVLDITGKIVYSTKQITNGKTILIQPDLVSGTYMLTIKLNNGTTDVHRLVINK